MLSAIIRFSLRFRGVVIALACLFLGYGMYALSEAQYDVFPEFAAPTVDIQTEAPGLAPEQVEVLVTQPLENALNGMPGIESIRSSSIQGLSLITLAFLPGRDLRADRQAVAERLAPAGQRLPQGVEAPTMTPMTSSSGDLMSIGLTSESKSLMEVRTAAEWTVKQRLLAVPGVSKVGIFGGDIRQIQIQIMPDRLVQYNLAVEDVLAAASKATGIRGAGFIDMPNQRIVLQAEGAAIDPAAIAKTAIVPPGGGSADAPLTLGDVARVVDAPAPAISAATVMGRPGVVLNIWSQFGANTLSVTRDVERALEELRPTLERDGIALDSRLFRAANFIETAVGNLRASLLLGAVLVVVVLFLFLMNVRTAAISCFAIPLSLLAAVAVLGRMGLSLNTMTLGGLAIAIGEVVDDAVIDVENILRRLRASHRRSDPAAVEQIVFSASLEVRGAVVFSTAAVALVFVPVLTMSGLAGRLFAPLGVAYILAILFSLLVALTVTPALCFVFLGESALEESEPRLVRRLKSAYRALLERIERRPGPLLAAVALLALAALAALPFLGGEFLPAFREGHFIVHMAAAPGTSLAETQRLGDRVTRDLLATPFVRSVAQRIGRAEADDVFGTNASEFEVDLEPGAPSDAEATLRELLAHFPGASFAVNSFLTERIEETLSGYTAPVVIRVFGSDLGAIDAKAREIAQVVKSVRGAADVQVQSPPGTPQLVLRLRPDDLARWGFDAVDVLDEVRVAFEGDEVGQVYDGNRVFPVSVILDPALRGSVEHVGDLPLRNANGTYVRLRQLADVFEASGRATVLHDGASRAQVITCGVTGRDVASFVEEAKRRIAAQVSFPAGAYAEFSGAAEAEARSRRDLAVHALMAGVGIVLLLSIVLGSGRNLALVLANLPFALVGGVLAVLVTGGALSVGSLVGFVTLFGITLRNSIMMISHYEHLVREEGMTWNMEAAIRGATERLAPILMTASVTALGLAPLALGSGSAGREIEGPMAQVILGGLVTSTVLNLLVLPTLALRFGRFDGEPVAAEEAEGKTGGSPAGTLPGSNSRGC